MKLLLHILLFSLLLSQTLIADEGTDSLVADFVCTTTYGVVPFTAQFTDLSDGNPTSWNWKFGDGGKSKDQNPSHIYTKPGTYNVELKISNATGESDISKEDYITVVVIAHPLSDTTLSGEVSGDLYDVDSSDNDYLIITEARSKWYNPARTSFLEHKWEFDLIEGSSITFYVEGFRPDNPDTDDFVLEYSIDNVNYRKLLTIIGTADSVYSASIPSTISGTVFIRVRDTDRRIFALSTDYVYIDNIYCQIKGKLPEPWFRMDRLNTFILLAVFTTILLIYIRLAKMGCPLFVRKLAGLDAIDEAVGRATEMGKPVLFMPGIQEVSEIQTIAGLSILGRVAAYTAEYETPLLVTVQYPVVMAAAQEIVKDSYINAGKKDLYTDKIVQYVAGSQFALAAAVNGIMTRIKPAANIFMGAFYAESLLLAETGNLTGAIQISGTANPEQLPFFIAACDYTLMGEELYAASAYLSGEPKMLGSLKGQDFMKIIIVVLIILSVIYLLIDWKAIFILKLLETS